MNTPYSRAPHVGSQGWSVSDGSPHAALLIDFDNVTMGRGSNLSSELKSLLNSDIIKGKVAVQRAYADWRRYPQYIVPLSEASIDLIFAPAYGSSKKNATDIRMAIDALELVFVRPEIGTFILLTGDSDFSSVVLKLKEYGKYVIGVGIQESSSDILVQNCDEYYSYTSITGLTKTSEAERAQFDPWVLVKKAAERMVERGDVMRSDRLKQVMREIDPGFSEGEHGFSKFSKFLAEASSKGLIQLKKMENGQYEVSPAKGRRGGGRSSRSSRAGTPATKAGESPLEHAFEILRVALGELTSDGRSPARDSDVKRRILVLEPSFDEAELGFPKFSRFLAQAAESSVVELRRKVPEGYTEVLLRAGAPESGRSAAEPSTAREDRDRSRERQDPVDDEAPVRGLGRRTRPRGRRQEGRADGEGDRGDAGSTPDSGRRSEDESTSEGRSRGRGPSRDESRGDSREESPEESREESRSRSRRGGRDEGSEGGRSRRGRRSKSSDESAERAEASSETGETRSETSETRTEGGRSRGRRGRGREKDVADAPVAEAPLAEDASTEMDAPDLTVSAMDNGSPEPTADEVPTPEPSVAEASADEAATDGPDTGDDDPPVQLGRGLADDMPVIRAVSSSQDSGGTRGRTLHPRQQRRRRGGGDGPPPIFEGQGISSTTGGSAPTSSTDDSRRSDTPSVGDASLAVPADIFEPGHGVIDPEALGLPTDPSAITTYLTHRYKGVGARTAESIVDRFGDEVFEVLHREPARVTEVLPEHRAAQLIQAWRVDLARRSEGETDS